MTGLDGHDCRIFRDFLPVDLHDSEQPALIFDRTETDGPHLTAHVHNCRRFDADFRCDLSSSSCDFNVSVAPLQDPCSIVLCTVGVSNSCLDRQSGAVFL